MSFLDFAVKMKILAEELTAQREDESILIAAEVIKQVRTRVQNEKVDADGSPFGQYSQALLPQWYFYGKSRTKTAEADLRAGDWFVSYAEFRELNNLDSGDISFTFTGDMWKDTGVVQVQNEDDVTIVTIGGQNERAKNILEWQEPRYGNIIEANEEEINFAIEAHQERISGTINRFLS
jgi:hypothetical protein